MSAKYKNEILALLKENEFLCNKYIYMVKMKI